jgi:sortase A
MLRAALVYTGHDPVTNGYTRHAQHRLRREVQRVRPLARTREGHAWATITIGRIGLRMVVVQGTGEEDLKLGPGHDVGSDDPGRGPGGLVYIAGHRTTYLHPFYYLNDVRPGDAITLSRGGSTYTYRVYNVRTVIPTDIGVLRRVHGQETLVLSACTPRFSASHRLIVFARRDRRPFVS